EDVVAEDAPDVVEHLLALVVLDAAEEAAAGHVLARRVLERRHDSYVHRLLVHPYGPEGKPCRAALQDAHAQARVAIHDAGADEGGHEAHAAPRVGRETTEKDVVPQILVAREVRRVPGQAMV